MPSPLFLSNVLSTKKRYFPPVTPLTELGTSSANFLSFFANRFFFPIKSKTLYCEGSSNSPFFFQGRSSAHALNALLVFFLPRCSLLDVPWNPCRLCPFFHLFCPSVSNDTLPYIIDSYPLCYSGQAVGLPLSFHASITPTPAY